MSKREPKLRKAKERAQKRKLSKKECQKKGGAQEERKESARTREKNGREWKSKETNDHHGPHQYLLHERINLKKNLPTEESLELVPPPTPRRNNQRGTERGWRDATASEPE